MLKLEQIPMRKDNYSYALIKNNSVIMVDPSEPHESLLYFSKNPHFSLEGIINTHSHMDHVGGNEILWQQWQCPIYGPDEEKDRIPYISNPLTDKEEMHVLGITISAHDVRAHTCGHMAFLVHTPLDVVIKQGHGRTSCDVRALAHHKVMFVGDSLFAGGCGRLFEGSPQNLVDCLSFYGRQDPHLLMACAHEYTKDNLSFALKMLPDHQDIITRLNNIDDLLFKEGASIPCFFSLELKTNPFLLALTEPYTKGFAKKFGLKSNELSAVLYALRNAKDQF